MSPNNLHPAELLLLTTIRIATTTSSGMNTGTGFFFSLNRNVEKQEHTPVIVTSRHVVEGAITGSLRFSLRDLNGNPIAGKYYDLLLDNFESRWVRHPEDDIDLCILPIAEIHREIRKLNQELYYATLSYANIPTKEQITNQFSRIEDVIVIGYPDGIWDNINNMPITRKGTTATPLQVDFVNTPRFLIDAAIYGGSSGSPIFIYNQGAYHVPSSGLAAGIRSYLVGIVYSVAQHTVTGELKIAGIPTATAPIAQTQIPNNLGVAFHARKLLDFESLC